MDHLFVARHGSADRTGALDYAYKDLVYGLAKRMKAIYGGPDVAILSSPVRRAAESAEIIREVFGLPEYMEDPALENAGSELREGELEHIHQLVETFNDRPSVILVGHLCAMRAYPKYFARVVWGEEERFIIEPGNCQANYINCDTKTIKLL